MTARRDLNPQDEKCDRTLVAGTVDGMGWIRCSFIFAYKFHHVTVMLHLAR